MAAPINDQQDTPGRSSPRRGGPEAAAEGDSPSVADPYSALSALAHDCASQSRYLSDALRCIAGYFASPFAAIHVRFASEVLQDDWHTGPTDPQFWKGSLHEFLTESLAGAAPRGKLLRSKTGSTKIAFISAPLVNAGGSPIGALALVVTRVDAKDVAVRLATLEGLARHASQAAQFVGKGSERTEPTDSSHRALAQAAAYTTDTELAFAITNELRNKLRCEQVALGVVDRSRVHVVAISGLDSVNKRTPGCVSIRAAMEECLDAGEPIVCQQGGGWSGDALGSGHRLHKQWQESAKGGAVASIPLGDGSKPLAILSLRRRADEPFAPEQIEAVRRNVESFGPALMLTRRATRSLARHGIDSMHGMIDALTARGGRGTKVCTLAGTLAALWFAFGTTTYELTVPCVVTPTHVRHITAPFDGVLASVAVIEGDHVTRGQTLCRFDHRDLDLKEAELLAELDVLERTKDRAVAEDSPVEVQLALANQQLTRAQINIVRQRIARATPVAPFDGVIVAGDLRRRVGGVLARGDPLFKVAPLGSLTVQMHIPEPASADVSAGLKGTFAVYARPNQTREVRIRRVLAEAQIREDKNVYLAEADIPAPGNWMRPGMEGFVKLTIGPRRVWWVALHKVVDYLRMTLWL